jgi:DNA-binding transcriptional LysR family regulator
MEFDRLRYLAAVARTGSMRSAAEALHVTPGAISKALARLEQEAGVELFMPDGRGVRLTQEGEWLATRAQHLVGEHAALGHDLETRRYRTTELCIATYDAFAEWLQALIARQFLPDTPLSMRERWPGEIEAAVAQAISDVGVTFAPVATAGVAHREVARVELAIYTRRGAFKGVASEDLPFAVPSHAVAGTSPYGALDGWPSDGVQRDVRFRASAHESRLELARTGVAAVLLPRFAAARHDERVPAAMRLEERPMPRGMRRPTRRVYLAHRDGPSASMATRIDAVRAAVVAMCAGPVMPPRARG